MLISDESYSLEKLDQEEKDLIEKELTADSGDEGEEEEDSEEEEEDEDEEGDSEDESEEDDEIDEEGGGGKRKALESTGLKMSAAGLCVNMGSFSDPDDIPGLAHFLEHMVFMGSKKFPGENEFESFIAKNGGYDNAHTDTETTVFWFESPRRHFHEGMDRFAQFFISPLMKEEAMQREREAVDSEFQMALPSDDNRVIQIFGGLATAHHPMAKFMWGNIDSLKPKGLSDKEIHERLHKFWSRHYTAQSLYLAVQSQHSLDSLQDWVVDCFKEVPNNGLPREDFSTMLEPFSSPDFHKLYEVSPVQNVYKLDLTWALPPLMDRYRVKPLHYLAWIIGHEGRGSLMSFLRRRVWALSIVAGNAGDGFENNSCYSMFPIVITLTKAGFDNIEKVVQSVFTYLDMLIEEGPNQRIFSEIQKIEDLDFAFQEEKHPNDNVETLCENMVFYPPERYLDGDDLLFEYDEALLRQCLEALVRDKVNIFLRSKEIPADSLDKVEPWFGTKHSQKDIPESWLAKSQEFRAEFHLPEPNLFIAEDTRVLQVAGETRHPVRVVSDPGGELFYKADTVFQQPRAHIAYLLRSPLQLQSLTNSCLLDLVVMCLLQNITEDVYPADLAQLGYSLYAHECGLVIRVSGLSDKLPNLFRVILDHLADFEVTNFVDIIQVSSHYLIYFAVRDDRVCVQRREGAAEAELPQPLHQGEQAGAGRAAVRAAGGAPRPAHEAQHRQGRLAPAGQGLRSHLQEVAVRAGAGAGQPQPGRGAGGGRGTAGPPPVLRPRARHRHGREVRGAAGRRGRAPVRQPRQHLGHQHAGDQLLPGGARLHPRPGGAGHDRAADGGARVRHAADPGAARILRLHDGPQHVRRARPVRHRQHPGHKVHTAARGRED